MPDSPFEFADTASARQQTTDLAMKLQHEKVAIVGVGGTGSFVLDFVAKTWVKEIHLFDGDEFLQHNAFRAPGACTREELGEAPNKAFFHGGKVLSDASWRSGTPRPGGRHERPSAWRLRHSLPLCRRWFREG